MLPALRTFSVSLLNLAPCCGAVLLLGGATAPLLLALPMGGRMQCTKTPRVLPTSQREPAGPANDAAMPVYLSFLICALSGGTCHVTVPLERAFIGVSACQIEGMMMTPQWQEQHPGWTVKRIRCSIGSRPRDEEAA